MSARTHEGDAPLGRPAQVPPRQHASPPPPVPPLSAPRFPYSPLRPARVWLREERQIELIGTGSRVTVSRPAEPLEEALMSHPARVLLRVAPCAAPVGARTAPGTPGQRCEPPLPGIPTPGLPVPGVRSRRAPTRGLPAGTTPGPAHGGRTAGAEPSAPVRRPRRPTRPPVTRSSRPPEAAVPSEDPSASGRSGESRTYAPAVTPDAPRGRDGQEGPHGRAEGERGRPHRDGRAARPGRWRQHTPPRTGGTPRS